MLALTSALKPGEIADSDAFNAQALEMTRASMEDKQLAHGQGAVVGGAELPKPACSHACLWPLAALRSLEEPESHSVALRF